MRLVKKLVAYLKLRPRRVEPSSRAATPSSSVYVPTLPPEVWMIIAGFIDPTELEKLNGVNRVFFEIVMDNRYREVGLVDSNPRSFFRKIEALKSDHIAYRVQVLKIWPCAVWDAIESGIPPPKQQPQSPLGLTAFSETLQGRGLQKSEVTTDFLIPDLPKSVESRCTDVLVTVKRLSNVRQLHLRWQSESQWLPRTHRPIWPILARAWPDIGPRLRALSLDMPLTVLAEFIESLPPTTEFINLEHLEILSTIDQSVMSSHDAFDVLLPLIHNHSGTLKSLSITTYGHIDLSSFFRGLGYLPHLTTLSFMISFDPNHVHDPRAFNQVLLNHPNLSSLTLRNRLSSSWGRWLPDGVVDRVTEEWLHGCFDGVSLGRLKEFKLGLNYRGEFQRLVIVAVKPICFPLSSLVLLDRCLTWDDLNIILGCLQPRCLKALSLFVHRFDMDVVNLLSKSCPSLQHLTLSIESIRVDPWDTDRSSYHRAEELLIETMRDGRGSELLEAWKLRSIDIWRCEYEQGRRRQWNLMRALADIVPALDSLPEGEMLDDHWPHLP